MTVSVYLTDNLTVLVTLPFTDNFPPLLLALVKGTTCFTHIDFYYLSCVAILSLTSAGYSTSTRNAVRIQPTVKQEVCGYCFISFYNFWLLGFIQFPSVNNCSQPQGFLPLLHTCNIAVSKLLETEQTPSYQDRDGNLMQVNVLKVWYCLAR